MERFWAKVRKGDGCWEWTAARAQRKGGVLSYGVIRISGRGRSAHRVAWELAHGSIPAGLWVLHHCDNQGCVRPSHLYLGTHRDNTRDAIERGRMFRGEQVTTHKLNPDAVRTIRTMAATGLATEVIGPRFGVSGRTVRYILTGKRWASVT